MQAGGRWPRRGRTDDSIRLRATAFLMFSLALKGASTDVAWIRQESSRIRHLWRLTASEVSSLFSGLAYPCNKVPSHAISLRQRQQRLGKARNDSDDFTCRHHPRTGRARPG